MRRWIFGLRWCPVLLIAMLTGCSVNPATGERQLNMMSEDQEISIGKQAAPGFLSEYGGEIPSDDIRLYVEELGTRLAEVSERPDLPWEFHVVDSEVINAFALPGGKVFMSRGLLAKMKNEAQLAGVLGHEIGHVTAQHIGQQMTRQQLIALGVVGLGVGAQFSDEDWVKILGAGAGVGGGLYMLSFGRDQEAQADELGVRYMSKLGYNPIGQVQVMEILKGASEGGGPPEFLSTHPLPDTRIRKLEKLIQEKYPDYNNPQRYSFYEDRFQRKVLAKLKDLPRARHTAGEAREQREQQQEELQRQQYQNRRGDAYEDLRRTYPGIHIMSDELALANGHEHRH